MKTDKYNITFLREENTLEDITILKIVTMHA